jgi:hypothetical protein
MTALILIGYLCLALAAASLLIPASIRLVRILGEAGTVVQGGRRRQIA